MANKPPYTITEKAADYLVKIAEEVMRLEYGTEFKRDIRLHRENRLKTIHSSLAIEGNALTLDEVAAIIEGKLVAGKQADIKEVKNAYEAYDMIMKYDPYSVRDFLKAHKLMTDGLVKEAGQFRSSDVGVFNDGVPIHIGARPQFVPELINDLFEWAKTSDIHPVLKSAIIHYEIEMIHPFADGNGRMGRLWQTLLLAKWNSIFAWLPMESALNKFRPQYYAAIEASRKANDSGAFIEFALSAIYDIVNAQKKRKAKHQVSHQVSHQVDLSDTQIAVLKALANDALKRKDIFALIGIRNDTRSFMRHIEPMMSGGLIEMTVPDKPNSRFQKYRLTQSGRFAISDYML